MAGAFRFHRPFALEVEGVGADVLGNGDINDAGGVLIAGGDGFKVFLLRHIGVASGAGGEEVAVPAGVEFGGYGGAPQQAGSGLKGGVPRLVLGQIQGVVGEVGAGFYQSVADAFLGFAVGALAEVAVNLFAPGVEQIFGRPVAVFKVAPGGHIVVLGNGPADVVVGDGVGHIVVVFLKLKLRRVDAQDDQAVILVAAPPFPQVGQGADAVDAGVSPEVHQHHLALGGQAVNGQGRIGVQPGVNPLHLGDVHTDAGAGCRQSGNGRRGYGGGRRGYAGGGGRRVVGWGIGIGIGGIGAGGRRWRRHRQRRGGGRAGRRGIGWAIGASAGDGRQQQQRQRRRQPDAGPGHAGQWGDEVKAVSHYNAQQTMGLG